MRAEGECAFFPPPPRRLCHFVSFQPRSARRRLLLALACLGAGSPKGGPITPASRQPALPLARPAALFLPSFLPRPGKAACCFLNEQGETRLCPPAAAVVIPLFSPSREKGRRGSSSPLSPPSSQLSLFLSVPPFLRGPPTLFVSLMALCLELFKQCEWTRFLGFSFWHAPLGMACVDDPVALKVVLLLLGLLFFFGRAVT